MSAGSAEQPKTATGAKSPQPGKTREEGYRLQSRPPWFRPNVTGKAELF